MGFATKGGDFWEGNCQARKFFWFHFALISYGNSGAYAHSSQGFPQPSAPGIWPLVTALKITTV